MKPEGCIHYRGALNPAHKTCKAGVDYRELVGHNNPGWVRLLPCSAFDALDGQTKVQCPHFRAPTPEEIDEDERKTNESMAKFMVAYTGKVREWREANKWDRKNPKSATGKVPCEVCHKGEIHLTMSSYNGHVWGKCTTDGCVSWME